MPYICLHSKDTKRNNYLLRDIIFIPNPNFETLPKPGYEDNFGILYSPFIIHEYCDFILNSKGELFHFPDLVQFPCCLVLLNNAEIPEIELLEALFFNKNPNFIDMEFYYIEENPILEGIPRELKTKERLQFLDQNLLASKSKFKTHFGCMRVWIITNENFTKR